MAGYEQAIVLEEDLDARIVSTVVVARGFDPGLCTLT